MSSASFPWVALGSDHFRQQLDSFGQIWNLWHQNDKRLTRPPIQLASYCKIRSGLARNELQIRLRKAWIAMRYYNPGIACELHDFHRTYKVPTGADIEQWLSTTFRVEMNRTMDKVIQTQGDHLTPVLYFCPNTEDRGGGELLIVCQHFFNDGRGTFYFWNTFLKLVESPCEVTFGDEAKYLPPARNGLIGLPSHPTITSFLKAANIIQEAFVMEPISVLRHDEGRPGVQPHGSLFKLTLSETKTAALLESCKRRGCTVTAAFKTSLMFACWAAQTRNSVSSKPRQSKFAAWEMFDFRPWFKGSFDPSQNFGTDYHGIVPSVFELQDKSFDDVVAEVDVWFKRTRSEYSSDPSGLDGIDCILREAWGGDRPTPSIPVFSSYGVVDQFVQQRYGKDLEVDDMWSGVLANNGSHNTWWIDSFQRKFRLFACFNEAFYDPIEFQKLMQDTMKRTLEGFGIQGCSGTEMTTLT